MLIYAGIDEAGYGPMFGPFVIGRTVFAVDEYDGVQLPCLWRALKRAVCRKPTDKRRRIAVNDSKLLYSPQVGLGHLERAVLGFGRLMDRQPAHVDEYLAAVAADAASAQPDQLWYVEPDGPAALPVSLEEPLIGIAHQQLQRASEAAGVRLVDAAAAVVFEDRFNRMVHATRSKARCAWTFIAGHLTDIWQQFGRHKPRVVIDRQGGRMRYREALVDVFPDAQLQVIDESTVSSSYALCDGDRAMTIQIEIDSEANHLPVALASMTAKYTRELLMHRFNRYWRAHLPQLRPTAGYFGDGRRFLDDIEPIIDRLGIERSTLIRAR
jgi:hypothetical protein